MSEQPTKPPRRRSIAGIGVRGACFLFGFVTSGDNAKSLLYLCFGLIYLWVIGAVAFAGAFVTLEIGLVRRKQEDLPG
jgi:hypothetical protein